MNTANNFDYIFCGLGMANLSLLVRGLEEGIFDHKAVLLIDPKPLADRGNDRTWCFWSDEALPFDFLVSKAWSKMHFFTQEGTHIPLRPRRYVYQMIRSADFYAYAQAVISQFSNITTVVASVSHIDSKIGRVTAGEQDYEAPVVFNSISPDLSSFGGHPTLLQHFKGLMIETPTLHQFEKHEMYLMDFRCPQTEGTTFFYVLPVAPNRIFVEYTFFSPKVLAEEVYREGLKEYISKTLKIRTFDVVEEEFGIIPMTSFPFKRNEGKVVNLGVVGGDTRGSTGYTFRNTQFVVGQLIKSIKKGKSLEVNEPVSAVHQMFDETILRVLLAQKEYNGAQIFADLFSKLPTHLMLSFLDGSTSSLENLRVMSAVKAQHFIKPFWNAYKNQKMKPS